VELDKAEDAYREQVGKGGSSKKHQFVQVEAGLSHTMLLNRKGEVYTFGEGLQGQLGVG
jgi:alpha-tubulin suppressor-like RCC1 family protein